MKPTYKIIIEDIKHYNGFSLGEQFTAQRIEGGTVVAQSVFQSRAEAENWIRRQHTDWLIAQFPNLKRIAA